MPTQHFLVPLDYSEYADQALEYAMMLAGKLQARLTLLHVIHESPIGTGEMASALPYSYMQDLEVEVQRSMEEQLKRVQDAGLEGDTIIVHGIPFQSIIDIAHEQNVNLIIMGTHGRTGLQHILMGSVAEKVVRLAPCSVLVTRKMASPPAE
jgi:universal stress protein A